MYLNNKYNNGPFEKVKHIQFNCIEKNSLF